MKQRIITALVAAPVVLALVFATNSLPIFALSIACIFLACDELAWIIYARRTWIPYLCASFFAVTAWVLQGLYRDHRERIVWALGVLLILALLWIWAELTRGEKRRIIVPGLVWIMAPVLGLLLLHYSVPKTRLALWWPNPLLMALVPIWAGDTLAILVGKRLGRRPLWPTISPKKTWEGAAANLGGCVAASCALAPSIGLNWRQGIFVGLVGGVLGQYGDLLESAIKRVFNAKDSGWIMPGHGGLLDRLDSILLPALPIAALILFYR